MDWISVKNDFPPKDENVILYDGNEVFCGALRDKESLSFDVQACDGICYGWYEKGNISHWMPLPKPPENIV